jgi:hypothetical protein
VSAATDDANIDPATDESTTDEPTTDEHGGYIRGGGGVQVDGRRVGLIVAGFAIIGLAVLVTVLSVGAVRENSRAHRLQRGAAVEATVTGCLGNASGTGITASGYTCRAAFTLDGRQYDDVLGGTTVLFPTGQTVRAVTVAGDPAILSTADAVAAGHSSWRPFVTPGVLLLVLVATIALTGWLTRGPATVASIDDRLDC